MDITVPTLIMREEEDEYIPHWAIGLMKQYNTAGNQTMQSIVLKKQIEVCFLSLAISGWTLQSAALCAFLSQFDASASLNLFLLRNHVEVEDSMVDNGEISKI